LTLYLVIPSRAAASVVVTYSTGGISLRFVIVLHSTLYTHLRQSQDAKFRPCLFSF
jgi:hypothetical protein